MNIEHFDSTHFLFDKTQYNYLDIFLQNDEEASFNGLPGFHTIRNELLHNNILFENGVIKSKIYGFLDLINIDLKDLNISNCQFKHCNFMNLNFDNIIMHSNIFLYCYFYNCTFYNCTFKDLTIKRCKLENTNISDSWASLKINNFNIINCTFENFQLDIDNMEVLKDIQTNSINVKNFNVKYIDTTLKNSKK